MQINRLIDWLIVIDWLIDWMIDWFCLLVNPTTGIDLRAAKIWVDGGTSSVTLIGVDGAGTYPG